MKDEMQVSLYFFDKAKELLCYVDTKYQDSFWSAFTPVCPRASLVTWAKAA